MESIEAKRGGINFTHIFLLRWDIYPFRKVPIESLKTIDSTLIVPIQTPTGIDDQLILGPRRYMMKFLRDIVSSWTQLLKEKKCEFVTNTEEQYRLVMAKHGMPVKEILVQFKKVH